MDEGEIQENIPQKDTNLQDPVPKYQTPLKYFNQSHLSHAEKLNWYQYHEEVSLDLQLQTMPQHYREYYDINVF